MLPDSREEPASEQRSEVELESVRLAQKQEVGLEECVFASELDEDFDGILFNFKNQRIFMLTLYQIHDHTCKNYHTCKSEIGDSHFTKLEVDNQVNYPIISRVLSRFIWS